MTDPAGGVDSWLLQHLACPRDHRPLEQTGRELRCPANHRYPVIDGVPVLLVEGQQQTHWVADLALQEAAAAASGEPEAPEAEELPDEPADASFIDPFVQRAIGATSGNLYRSLVGRLREYPVPHLRAPAGDGRPLLDIGCNWGRWTVAAARAGWRPVGIDPSLEALRAARRVCRQLEVEAHFVAADARFLPFAASTFDLAFSYSVLQHFSKSDVRSCLVEVARILADDGSALIQMPNVFGLRNLYHQLRRRFRRARDFEVRYWRPGELATTFQLLLGSADLSVDGFLSLNAQPAEAHLLPRRYRLLIGLSELLRRTSLRFPPLIRMADSLYVSAPVHGHGPEARRRATPEAG